MRLRRIYAGVAAAAALGLALTACAPADTGDGGDDAGTASQSISATVGPVDFTSYNGFASASYNTYNSAIVDLLKVGFVYYGPDGSIVPNEDLGSFELVSEDPMVVEFTISDDAVWSDGTPITVADAILAWGIQNPNLSTEVDEDGNPVPLFDSVSQDLGNTVPAGPQGDPSGKTFTMEFAAPDPDWQIQTYLLDPAHVVAEQAGMTVEELTEAILSGDSEALAPAAEFWNNGWTTEPGTLPDTALIPSSGPYILDSWSATQSVTLKANPEYYGEQLAPQNDELVFRFIDQASMPQALQNGDVDVIAPQPTVDTINQLEEMGDAVSVYTGPTLTWEHLDLNQREGAIFSNAELRKAFAMCVPRQLIVDNLIKPLDPEAEVMNSREVFPFQENYDEVVAASYDGRYDEVDIEGAKAIVEAEGATGTEVTIKYTAGNQRRADEVAMIKSSCDEAGFNIVDGATEDFSADAAAGNFDVALFAWAGSGQITSGQNIYASGKPQNWVGYSNPEVDAAWDTLASSLDPEVHLEQTKIIEKHLWDDLYSIPLFAHPGVDAASSDIANVEHTTTQSGVTWNAYAWNRAE